MAKNNSTSESILMQVAFKAVVESGSAVTDEAVLAFYDQLIRLHAARSISLEESNRGGGGGGYQKKEPKPLPAGVVAFTDAAGTSWNDFRAVKGQPDGVVAGFPDFKTADNKDSVWIYRQDGTPTDEGTALAAAADAMKALIAPM